MSETTEILYDLYEKLNELHLYIGESSSFRFLLNAKDNRFELVEKYSATPENIQRIIASIDFNITNLDQIGFEYPEGPNWHWLCSRLAGKHSVKAGTDYISGRKFIGAGEKIRLFIDLIDNLICNLENKRIGINKEKVKGVGIKETLLILNDHDKEAANMQYKKLMKPHHKDRPVPIGKDPSHKQRDLFEPSPLVNWIEKIECFLPIDKCQLFQRLTDMAREPR